MFIAIHDAQAFESMLLVRAAADIEYLVKESEVITGQPGRKFGMVGADRLVYRIQWHRIGCKVQRLDDAGMPPARRCGRSLRTVELRQAVADGAGDPVLMSMMRAAALRDSESSSACSIPSRV